MRIVAVKQCDAWEPVSKGESPLAGKRALHPGSIYTLAEGTEFSSVPEMNALRQHRVPGNRVDLDKAVKEGLVKREKVSA